MSAPSPRHEAAIADLMVSHPDMCRRGFAHAVERVAQASGARIAKPGFIPDAYRIDAENREILIYEVIAANEIGDVKLSVLGEFWADWDGEDADDWLPRLFVKRIGEPMFEIDLCEAFHGVSLARAVTAHESRRTLGLRFGGGR